MIPQSTSSLLRQYADRYETADFIVGDPSWWMHQVAGRENQEATAFVASALSYGSRQQFMPKIGSLLDMACGDMHAWLVSGGFEHAFRHGDTRCFYRLYNNSTMNAFFAAYRDLLLAHGTLGAYIRLSATDTLSAIDAVCQWFNAHGSSGVIPKDTASACKRVCMFLRWMVRSNSPVDLGLWSDLIDRRTLIMPLDTHVLQEATKLGLLSSRCANMNTARRLTATLAEVFPDDPLRGDFALFGYGVNHT